uniref:C2orf72-like C-terminal domain-containing protein n=1 Tax=Spermophilus dauricus TaxID=99837 RepID=A0A8C9UWP2_SPEDA
MEQRPRTQPSVTQESSEAQQEILAQSIGGRGRVLLVRELWKQDDCCKDLQNFPEQASTHQLTRSSSTRATTAHKQRRLPGEQGAQLPLVLGRASALCTQLPRLQLVLEQVRARDSRPPAALIGILVQPQPEEEAQARCLLENLLCGIFAQHNPAVEVHTAVFCPGRPQGVLDVQRAASQVRKPDGAMRTWERPGLPGLLACFTWGPWSQRKDQDATSSRKNFQDSQEELALTTIFPNGDCEDRGSGPKACDGVVHTPPEPTGETR